MTDCKAGPITPLEPAAVDATITGTPGLLVIDFWAPWCPPCVVLLTLIAELVPEFEGRVTFTKFNVDDDSARAVAMGIRGVPTLIFFRDGVEVERLVGTENQCALRRRLERLVGGASFGKSDSGVCEESE
ncbi:MAG TPA: thioredoxin domain-containing protein [Candidatus Eisenbacteria bacterium]